MREKLNLLSGSVLRGFQMLFSIVVLGLSVTLVKTYAGGWPKQTEERPSAPWTLSLATAIGALSLVAAVFSLVIAWTNLLREYIEMVVDVIVVVANMVGGVIIASKLKGKNCSDKSFGNRAGNGDYPFTGSLANIDILIGGCKKYTAATGPSWTCGNSPFDHDRNNQLNIRCSQSRTDSVFMFLTMVVCFGAMVLTFMRMKKNV